jgi:hypothetical protein
MDFCEHDNESSGSVKSYKIFEQQNKYWLLKRNSAPRMCLCVIISAHMWLRKLCISSQYIIKSFDFHFIKCIVILVAGSS